MSNASKKWRIILLAALLLPTIIGLGNPCLAASKKSTPTHAGHDNGAATNRKAAQSVSSRTFEYQIAPVSSFVERHLEIKDLLASTRSTTQNLEIILVDRQISLLQNEPIEYVRYATRALRSEGLKDVAQVTIQFNPAYQRLKLHAIRVIRDGRAMDRTQQVTLDLLRREEGLDQHVYAGDVTAVGLLPDIRVKDIIEVEYSIIGDNPIFASRYSADLPLSFDVSVTAFNFRLLSSENRHLRVKAPSAYPIQRTSKSGIVTHALFTQNLAIYSDDADRPRWFDPVQRIEISEYDGWPDVQRWATGLFELKGDLSPALRELIAGWKNDPGSAPQKTVAALRWVQGNIRYFGIELGINSHLPAHPNITLERRFGDCKDKTFLLTTILNAIGISAQPALVSTRFHRGIDSKQAAPILFDHVIVRANVDGKVYWLDPTLPVQYGSLDEIGDRDYGKALLIGAQDEALQDTMQAFSANDVTTTTDTFTVTAFNAPVQLSSETTLRGQAAEGMRGIYASLPKDEFIRSFQSGMQRAFPTAKTTEQLIVQDDHDRNTFKLIEHYVLDDLFQYKQGKFSVEIVAIPLLDLLRTPRIPNRSTPYKLPYPNETRHTIRINLPEHGIRSEPAPSIERDAYWNLKSTYKVTPQSIQRELVVSARQEYVPAQDIANYINLTQKLRGRMGLSFTLKVAELSESDLRTLGRTLKKYDRYGKTHSGAVKAEIDALFGIKQITLDIQSNKLTGKQTADAYHERAIYKDEIEGMASAIPDIDAAIKIEPGNPRHWYAKGRILVGGGHFMEAIEAFKTAEDKDHADATEAIDHKSHGTALYYLGRYQEAAERFARAARISNQEGAAYATYWENLAQQRIGGKAIGELATTPSPADETVWPYPIGSMLAGHITPEKLIELAYSNDPGVKRDQLCEAYFYIAQRLALEGKAQEARQYFEKTVSLKVLPYAEHRYAQIELQRLGKNVP